MKKLLSILFLVITGTISHAQTTETVQYTWMSGPNTLNAASAFGTKGVPSTTNTPASIYGSMTWSDNTGNLWLFGGSPTSTNKFNALFRYNTATNEWTWMTGANTYNSAGTYGTKGIASASNTPGARVGSVTWKGADGNLYLYGGFGYASTATIGDLNDVWKFDVTTGQWTWIAGSNTINPALVYGTQGVTTSSNTPNGRNGCAGWVDNNGNFWMYGGVNNAATRYYVDLWKFEITTNQWTYMDGLTIFNTNGTYGTKGVSAPGNHPGSRVGVVSVTDANNNLWLFGGMFSGGGEFNDLWKYDIALGEWTWISGSNITAQQGIYGTKGVAAATNKPGSRRNALGWMKNNAIYVHGGYGYHSAALNGYMNDMWKYDIALGQWAWLSGIDGRNTASVHGTKGVTAISSLIGGRSEASSFQDNSGSFWIFGGKDFSVGGVQNANDLWKLDFCNTPTAVNATASTNTLICGGNTATLSATGAGNLSWYTAATGGAFVASGANFTTPTLTSTTTYYVQDSTCGPGNRVAVTVSVMPMPNLAVANLSVCATGSVNLVASGANTYTWSTGSNSTTLTTFPSANETYTLSGTNTTTGCMNTIVRTLTVVPLPTLTVTPSFTICSGKPATVSASGANTYVWNGISAANPFTNSPTTSGNYTVVGTGTGNCQSTAYVFVGVNASPILTLTPTSNTMCAGALLTLSVTGAPSYTWTGGSNGNTLQISPTSNTSYTVIGEAVNGCTTAAVKNISTLVSPTVSIAGSNILCAGNVVPLTGSGATTYTWSTGAFTSSIIISPTITTTYSLTGKNANVCTNTTTILITVNPLPTLNVSTTDVILCTGNTATLSVLGATSYTWSDSSNGTDLVVTPSVTTSYSVMGTDANGCNNLSSFTQSVSLCTGIQQINTDMNSVLVFPNPNNGEFTIQSQKADVINVTNELGQLVETVELNQQNNFSYKVNHLQSGIYFLVGKSIKQKVIVSK